MTLAVVGGVKLTQLPPAPVAIAQGGTGAITAPAALGALGGLDNTAHGLINHSAVLGVPAAEAFTSGVHSGASHLGLPGTGGLSRLNLFSDSIGIVPFDIPRASRVGTVLSLFYIAPVAGVIDFVDLERGVAFAVDEFEVTINGIAIGVPMVVPSSGVVFQSSFPIGGVPFLAGDHIGVRHTLGGTTGIFLSAHVWVRWA